MHPASLKSKIFLDSGDPAETREAIRLLGWLDGQTTNPSLIAKNPEIKARLDRGERLSRAEADRFYRAVVEEVSSLIPNGSVSIEVYADRTTTPEQMLAEGSEKFCWIPNAHIKYPTTAAGLRTARASINQGMRVNMTLCFSQSQAAAVFAATAGAPAGAVFVSPFVGRLDDIGENGMELIKNILAMYQSGDGHVEVLTASVRSLNHLLYAIQLGSHIITAPLKVLKEWTEAGTPLPGNDEKLGLSLPGNDEKLPGNESGFHYDSKALKPIPYEPLDLSAEWSRFNLDHSLTEKGIEKFAADWNALIM